MKPDLRCYYHPEREATSQCDHCGDYLCAWCVHEHDELHVCARCLQDVTPRDEIGRSAKIACVLNALACTFWLVMILEEMLHLLVLPMSLPGKLAVISMVTSMLAVLLALIGMRGSANGELPFRWSVLISAGSSALLIAMGLLEPIGISRTGWMLIFSGCLVLQMASAVLLGASVCKKAKPIWALAAALLAPLMFGAFLLSILVEECF